MRRVLFAGLLMAGLGLTAGDAKANFCFEFNRCTHAKLSFTIPSFYFGWYCPPACPAPGCDHGHGHGHGFSFGHAPYYGDFGYAAQALPMTQPNYAYYYGYSPYGYTPPQQPTGTAGATYPTPAPMPNFYRPANYSVAPYGNINFTLTGFGN